MKHQLRKTNGYWQCTVCQWRWPSRRLTACPGMRRYTLDNLPSYLKTLPQLELLGLKPPDLVPDACYYRRLAPHWLYFYDVRKSLPLKARPLQRLKSQVNLWLQQYDRCQWCGWSAPSDPGLHLLSGGFCSACHFEQVWLRQCKQIVVWAQERLHSEQVIILDTETVGSLNDLDLSELTILDMQGRVLINMWLRHRQWTATLERHFPWTWSSVRPAPPPPRFSDIWPQVIALFERSSTVIAYNVAFHRDALAQSAHRYGLSLPPLQWECLMTNYATFYGQVRLDEYGRFDERDPFQWQSRVNACKQQCIPCSRSEQAKQHAIKDLAILRALAAGAQQWQR
jgi:hypothetical protein